MICRDGRLVSSYSQIEKYLNCPKSWMFQYVNKIQSDGKSKHLEYGLAVHETMEHYFTAKRDGKIPELGELLDIYNMFYEMHDIPFDTEEEAMEYKRCGEEAVTRLFNPANEIEKLMTAETTEILGVEMPIDVVIKMKPFHYKYTDKDDVEYEKEFDEVHIIGFVDLVLRTPEGIVVVDHKSGKTLFNKEKLDHNLQFPIYAMAVKQMYGELPVMCYYNFTKLHKCQKVSISEERLEQSEQEIVAVFKKMKQTRHSAKPSFLCYWCNYSKYQLNICKYSSDFKPKSAK